MPRTLKIVLSVIGAVIAILLIGIAIIAATFNPNDYKSIIIQKVQEKTQRTLAIPGDIKLTFFPKLGIDLGKLTISERRSSDQFASVERARLSVALLPLLRKQVVVDRIVIDGLRADIARAKDGRTNFDDLVAKQAPDAAPDTQPASEMAFNVEGIELTDSAITFDDRQQQRKLVLTNLNLETGKIANGATSNIDLAVDIRADQPAINATLVASSDVMLDFERQHFRLNTLDATVKGKLLDWTDTQLEVRGNANLQPKTGQFAFDNLTASFSGKQAAQTLNAKLMLPRLAITDRTVTGDKLSGNATLVNGARTITAAFSTPSFDGTRQAFTLPALTLNAAIKDAALAANAQLSGALSGNLDKMTFNMPTLSLTVDGKQGDKLINGTLTTPLAADLRAKTIALPGLAAAFTLPNPGGGTMKLSASGRASADLAKSSASAVLKGKLDDSNIDATLGASRFSPLASTFDIGIDRIDIDRYRTPTNASAGAAPPTQATPAAAARQATADDKPAAADAPIDLSALKTLTTSGKLRIGALKVNNIRASNVRAGVRVTGGKADINPLQANLYGGSAAGSLSAQAAAVPQFAVRQTLAGIDVGALLKDAIAKQPIDGRGTVALDIATRGTTTAQLKQNLNGSATLTLRDGAVRGVNIAQAVREAKAKIGEIRGKPQAQSGTASVEQKTDFSELSGSFRIAQGVARNDDLLLKSPLLRVGGAGNIDLGAERIDYLVKATIVSTLQGQGGPELQALKGLTVPVRLSGPFTAIGWKVDLGAIVRDVAKQKIDEKKDEVKNKIQEKLQDKLKDLFGK